MDRTEQNTRDEHRPSGEVRNKGVRSHASNDVSEFVNVRWPAWSCSPVRFPATRILHQIEQYLALIDRSTCVTYDPVHRAANNTIPSTSDHTNSPRSRRLITVASSAVANATFQISAPLHITSTRHVVSRASDAATGVLSSTAIHHSKASCRFYRTSGAIRVIEDRLPFGRERSSRRDRIHARPTRGVSALIIQGECWLVQ